MALLYGIPVLLPVLPPVVPPGRAHLFGFASGAISPLPVPVASVVPVSPSGSIPALARMFA